MSLISLFLTLAAVHLAALVAPGPDFALMLRASLYQGRRQALWMALGLSSSILVHSLVVLFAFGLISRWLPELLRWLPLIGGSWLLWLAWQCARSAAKALPALTPAAAPEGSAWAAGFATSILNPKTYLYFFTLVGGLLPAQLGMAPRLGIAALFFCLAFAWFGMLGWCLGSASVRERLLGWRQWLEGSTALVFAVVAVLMLAQFRP